MTLYLCDDTRLSEVAHLAKANGFGIEVQSFYHPDFLTKEPDAVRTHETALSGITARSLHGPFGDLCPGSIDSMVRGVARNRFDLAARVAGQLGVTHLVLHHGYVPGTSSPSGWLSRSTRFWREYLDSLPESVEVHIENMLERDPALISEVVRSVDRRNFDVCLDVGHANLTKAKATDWIERLGPQIGYVHLHDNHGETDEHLGLGRGTAPLAEVLRALQQCAPDAIWALETQVPETEESIAWLSNNGFLPASK